MDERDIWLNRISQTLRHYGPQWGDTAEAASRAADYADSASLEYRLRWHDEEAPDEGRA